MIQSQSNHDAESPLSLQGPAPFVAEKIDFLLLLVVVALVLFGLIMVYSSSFIYAQEKTGDGYAFIRKQLVYAGLGFATLFGVCKMDYRRWKLWAYPVLGLATFLL